MSGTAVPMRAPAVPVVDVDDLETLDAAMHAHLERGDLRGAVRLLCSATGALESEGRADAAILRLDALVREVALRGGRPGLQGKLWAARSSALRAAGRTAEAIDASQEAVALLEGRAPDSVVATLRHDRAVLLAEDSHPEEAIAGLVQAREAFLAARDRLGVAACDHNLSFVLHDLATFDDAMEYLTEARDIFLAIDMAEEAAACDQNLGVVLYDLGRFEEAGRRFAVARHRFTEVGAERSAGECDSNLATLLETMGHADEAQTYRRRAADAGVDAPLDMGMSGQVPAVGAVEPSS